MGKVGALIPNRSKDKRSDVAVLYGRSMQDHREEHFVIMVCDGLPMGLAFRRAGFESRDHGAPAKLFNLQGFKSGPQQSWKLARRQAP